jgi:hypothetical protein
MRSTRDLPTLGVPSFEIVSHLPRKLVSLLARFSGKARDLGLLVSVSGRSRILTTRRQKSAWVSPNRSTAPMTSSDAIAAFLAWNSSHV